MNELKDRIKSVRKNAGMTQEKFGEMIGVGKMAVTYYEGGKRTPPPSTIKLISEKFHINETWLLTGEGEMQDVETHEQRIAQVVQALTIKSDVVKSAMITALSRMDEQELRKLLVMILNALTDQGVDITEFLK